MMTQSKSAKSAARAARLRAALRENLKRRKAQARERTSQESGDSAAASHDSAGFVVDKRKG
jgi:predicted phage gp36 major capsid-like protein